MSMAIMLNDKNEAMLMHTEPLGFLPYWVEYSPDLGGVRLVSQDGMEFQTEVIILPGFEEKLKYVKKIMVVLMKEQKPVEGFSVSFIYQGL